MRRASIVAAVVAVLAAGWSAAPAKAQGKQSFERIERGRYLTTMGDCAACHTRLGGEPFAGGRPIETPFGDIIAPNLTPDRRTGIGAWTDEEFVRAVRRGVRPDGAHLYPALPYPSFAKASRDDILAVRAYLRTLDPVDNAVEPNALLPFPFNMRFILYFWKLLFFDEGEFRPDPAKSAEWNRGAYIVQGLGHCGACHTAKNILGGDRASEPLQGGPLQNWFAPNLTADARVGLGDWSNEEIVEYLKTGRNGKSAASGPMAEVVELSTSQMTDADLAAIAVYLKDGPGLKNEAAARSPEPLAADDPRMMAGEAIYADNCAACHVGKGEGVAKLFPELRGSAVVQQRGAETLLRVILQGTRAAATDAAPTAPAMPEFAWKLSDAQIAAVATYIRNSWGNAASPVAPEDAAKMRGTLKGE